MVGRTLLTAAAAIASLASTAFATPIGAAEVSKRQNMDNTILQFALTLEHLENVFYKQVLQNFTVNDFIAAGYSADYYNNIKYIAYDEQTHVQALSAALQAAGVTPVQACTYNFPYTDVPSFITLSSVLEGVGTSAYLGAAGLITSKAYLTTAGSILAVEALHTSMQRLAIGEVPMANPFYTPLDPMSVYTLATMFIVSCPSSNMALPFTAFPTLSVSGNVCTCEEPNCGSPSQYIKRDADASPSNQWHGGNHWGKHGGNKGGNNGNTCTPPSAGQRVTFTTTKNIPAGSYVTFVSGLTVTSVQGNVEGKSISATIPSGIMGQSYVFVSKSDQEGTFSDTQVLFGPAVLEVNPPAPAINYSQSK